MDVLLWVLFGVYGMFLFNFGIYWERGTWGRLFKTELPVTPAFLDVSKGFKCHFQSSALHRE